MIVLSYPKSGRTWLLHMLAEYHGWFLANKDLSTHGIRQLECGRIATRDWVLGYHEVEIDTLKRISDLYNKRVIYLLRDPRDCLASWHAYYLHHRTGPVRRNARRVRLKCFRERFIRDFLSGWKEHVHTYQAHAERLVRYEELLHNPTKVLSELLEDVNEERLNKAVELHRFEKQTHRKPGTEDPRSFTRKGIQGDWVNQFGDHSSRQMIQSLIGNELETFGYGLG